MRNIRICALAATSLLAVALSACAAGESGGGTDGEFTPRGDVSMVVPFGAGGGSDRAGRSTAAAIEGVRDINVYVENREGGSGAVGYSFFLGRQGDPEVLLAAETSLLSLPLTGDVGFDHTDFTPIMMIAEDFTLLVTAPDAPYETCADVVEVAGSERVVAGISGRTGLDNVVFTLIEQETGTSFDRVPFESGGEVVAALLGGQIDVASLNPGEVVGQLEAGGLKALCAVSEERYSQYPALADIPTAGEQGIDVAYAQFRGVIAPGGISDSARQYWIETMTQVLETEEYQQYLADNYLQANTAAGDDFTAYLEQNNQVLAGALAR